MKHEGAIGKFLGAAGAKGAAATAAAAPVAIAGRWVNQYRSTVDFVVSNTNELTGTYTSQAGAGPVTGPLRGYITSDIVAFSVLWGTGGRGSITSWVGQIVNDNGTEVLKTLWHLVVDVDDADEAQNLYRTIMTGADEFRRAPAGP